MTLPIKFSRAKNTKIRLNGAHRGDSAEAWESLERTWEEYWHPRGKERLEVGEKAFIDGMYLRGFIYGIILINNPKSTMVQRLSGLTWCSATH